MRKLLLASVATLGLAGAYGTAHAQQADDAGQATVSAFGGATSGLSQAPGTLVVRMNGRVYTETGYYSLGAVNNTIYYNPYTAQASEVPFLSGPALNAATVVGGVPMALPQFYGSAAQATALGYKPSGPGQNVVVVPNQPQHNEQDHYAVYTYFRLYPGFDGVAANGLMYGAGVEIRQDGNWAAGPGQADASVSGQASRQGLLYVRRAWGYVGTPKLGILRMGGTDGPADLFMVGNNENFGDVGINGSANGYIPTNLWYYWPFADGGSYYDIQKIVYLSPAYAGFDFGLMFAPTMTGENGAAGNNGCNAPNAGRAGGINSLVVSGPGIAGAGCSLLSSTSTGDYIRARNLWEGGIRYRGLFGPVGFAAYADYIGSGVVSDARAVKINQVDGYSIGSGGAQITIGGLTIGGMARGGRVNTTGAWQTVIKGAAPEVDVEFGGSYTWGPFIVGAHFAQSWLAGSSGPTTNVINGVEVSTGIPATVGQRRERGFAVGGTYSVAPGLALNLTYVWTERKENGFDFITNQAAYPSNVTNTTGCGPSGLAGNTSACLHNQVTAQMLVLGASFTW
jgi:hypothetical protein